VFRGVENLAEILVRPSLFFDVDDKSFHESID